MKKNNIKIMRVLFFSIILILFASCHPYKVHKIKGIDLNTIQGDTTFRLRSDGLYNTIDVASDELYVFNTGDPEIDSFRGKFMTFNPLVIVNAQKIMLENDAYTHDATLHIKYYGVNNLVDFVGDYVVRKDTIWAKIPILFNGQGMVPKIHESYFQGEIRNRDTIVNWRMIRPFPKPIKSLNKKSLKMFQTPHQLVFIESKELMGLDSLYQQRLKEKEKTK